MQIEGVAQAVIELMSARGDYKLFRVSDTRIAYALRVDILDNR